MRQRRVVLGVGIAGYPIGGIGNTWIFLNWALAFRKLGWEVWLVEELPADRLAGLEGSLTLAQSPHAAHWASMLKRFGLQGTLVLEGEPWPEDGFETFVSGADFFLNISGHFKRLDLVAAIPRRIYLDLDPGFTQVWHQVYHVAMNFEGHTDFATIALGWNDPESRVPRDDRTWLSVAPPVDLDCWAEVPMPSQGAWTTVTHWYGYPRIEWNGLALDNKSSEFLKIAALPGRVRQTLRIASDLQPDWDDYRSVTHYGWEVVPVKEVCRDVESYADFIRASVGEFSVAKGGYVTMNSGWFSDRTVCYLASGRPAIVQETGWSRHLPTGQGLAGFQNREEAAAALERVAADPEKAGAEARRIAERFFDGPKVVQDFLERLG
ncbi:MAG: hypothetical protein OHK005_07940 [Candidatus Methylacidiphilales bacterium]